jgi:hypothetical protein
VRGEIVARSRNDCGSGNTTTRSLSVVDLHVTVSITTAFNVAMEAQDWVSFSSFRVLRSDVRNRDVFRS